MSSEQLITLLGALGVTGLVGAITMLVRTLSGKASRYMDARIKLAETQAANEERHLQIQERDLQLREFQLSLDQRKLQEMRWSRKVQQEACGVKSVPGEDTGRYHLDESELAWTREERPLASRETPREGGGGPIARPPKDDDGLSRGWAGDPEDFPQLLRLSLPTMWG